jgi:mannosyltransferase
MSTTWWPSLPARDRNLLIAVMLLATCMRFIGITSESFWVDEAASWMFSQLPFAELWGGIPYEPHPPMFYTFLKFWIAIFGRSEFAMRSLSAVLNLATVYLVFLIGRLAVRGRDGFWLGLFGAVVFAMHPVQIHYAQEARSYATLTLAAAMVLLPLVWWLKHPSVLAVRPRDLIRNATRREWQAIALFVIGAALGFWMHHTTILLLGVIMSLGALLIALRSQSPGQVLVNFVLMGACILLLWLPNGFLLLHSLRDVEADYWLQAPNRYEIVYRADYLLGTARVDGLSMRMRIIDMAVVGLIAASGALYIFRRAGWRIALFLASAAIVPVIVCLIATFTITPIFMPRPMLWVEVAYSVLLGASLLWIRSVPLRSAAAAIAFAVLMTIAVVNRIPKEPWRQIVAMLEHETTPQDTIITWYNYSQVPLRYYDAAERIPAKSVRLWKDTNAAYPTLGESIAPSYRISTDEVMKRVQAAEQTHAAVWVVVHGSTNDVTVIAINNYLRSVRGNPEIKVDFQLPTGIDPKVLVAKYPPRAGA